LLSFSRQGRAAFSGTEAVRPRRSFFWRLLRAGLSRAGEPQITENRDRARHSVQAAATMTELNARGMPGRSWAVEVLDLSKGGAAFATAIFIAPGTPVIIQFPAGEDGPGRSLMGTTRHIRRRNELEFAVGVKFESSRGRVPGSHRVEMIDAA
jgi:hypothetical protein